MNINCGEAHNRFLLDAVIKAGEEKTIASFSDYRGICPDCYAINKMGASECGDGGYIIHECACGFFESNTCLTLMKTGVFAVSQKFVSKE